MQVVVSVEDAGVGAGFGSWCSMPARALVEVDGFAAAMLVVVEVSVCVGGFALEDVGGVVVEVVGVEFAGGG